MNRLRNLISCALVAALLYLGFSFWSGPVQLGQEKLRHEISELEADIGNLSRRVTALNKTESNITFPEGLVWQSVSRSDAEIALQNQIVRLTEEKGLVPINFGTTELAGGGDREQIAFEFEGEAQLADFYMLLAAVEELEPKVAISTLRMRPIQRQNSEEGDVAVYVQVRFWTYWDETT